MIEFVYDDGGRKRAGFNGVAPGDCVVRALAIASASSYREVYDLINDEARIERPGKARRRSSARTGVHMPTIKRVAAELGGEWTPTMSIGSGCTVHLREDELPYGNVVVSLSKHVAAVIDGVLHDLDDCSRNGTRCVYGYWTWWS